MKIMLVAGARPNFMKVASIVHAVRAYNDAASSPLDYLLVHTGQHYDKEMSDSFFADLELPVPHVNLGVGSSSHARQTADIMTGIEPVLLREIPEVLVVVGDVNSTVACALVAAKIAFPTISGLGMSRPLIAHVEAGLRSFDRSMPEELNRVLTDALCDLLSVTERDAEKQQGAKSPIDGSIRLALVAQADARRIAVQSVIRAFSRREAINGAKSLV